MTKAKVVFNKIAKKDEWTGWNTAELGASLGAVAAGAYLLSKRKSPVTNWKINTGAVKKDLQEMGERLATESANNTKNIINNKANEINKKINAYKNKHGIN